MRKKKPREEYEDDGRTIAPMNVDGMPWYIPEEQRLKRTESAQNRHGSQDELSPKERRSMLAGVLGAVFVVAAVFGLVYLAFILFAVNIWFK